MICGLGQVGLGSGLDAIFNFVQYLGISFAHFEKFSFIRLFGIVWRIELSHNEDLMEDLIYVLPEESMDRSIGDRETKRNLLKVKNRSQ